MYSSSHHLLEKRALTNTGRGTGHGGIAGAQVGECHTYSNGFTRYFFFFFHLLRKVTSLKGRLTVGEHCVMSRLHRLGHWRAVGTVLILRWIITENSPTRASENECGQVSIKLVPSEGTILPEPSGLCQRNKTTPKYERNIPAIIAPLGLYTSTLRF